MISVKTIAVALMFLLVGLSYSFELGAVRQMLFRTQRNPFI